MNRRILLLLLLLALGAVSFWLWKRDTGSTLAGPMADFMVADTAAIDRIFIAEEDGKSVDLRRVSPGSPEWTVNGMPADAPRVNLLLKTFLRVEVRSPVAKAAQANVLKVMSSTAKKVEIYQGGSVPVKIWYVGHATKDHYGTYMLLEIPGKGKSSAPFELGMSGFTGYLSTRFHATLDDWRSSIVFSYPDLSRVKEMKVEHPEVPPASFAVRNEAGRISLLDGNGQPLPHFDTTAVQDMLLQLRGLHYEFLERILSAHMRDSITAQPPVHVVTITETEGNSERVVFWRKPTYSGQKDIDFKLLSGDDPSRMYAMLDDTALVVVQRHLFDRIMPALKDLAPMR